MCDTPHVHHRCPCTYPKPTQKETLAAIVGLGLIYLLYRSHYLPLWR
jgi:hypothetical protein